VEHWIAERRAGIEAAREPFEAILPYLDLDEGDGWGRRKGSRALHRLKEATKALHRWRSVNNQQMQGNEVEKLAVRVVAAQMADDIAEASTGQDPHTIAWVLAGLRCPRRPFCTGCNACFTVTSPLRHSGPQEG
jgi:hypothetical protein